MDEMLRWILILFSFFNASLAQECPEGWTLGGLPDPPIDGLNLEGVKCFKQFVSPKLNFDEAVDFCKEESTDKFENGKLLEVKNVAQTPAGFFTTQNVRLDALTGGNGPIKDSDGNTIPDTDFTLQGFQVPHGALGQTVVMDKGGLETTISTVQKVAFACQIDPFYPTTTTTTTTTIKTTTVIVTTARPGGGGGGGGGGGSGGCVSPGSTVILRPNACACIQSHWGYGFRPFGRCMFHWRFQHYPRSPCQGLRVSFCNKLFSIPSVGAPYFCATNKFYFKSPSGCRQICGNCPPTPFTTRQRFFDASFIGQWNPYGGMGAKATICSTNC